MKCVKYLALIVLVLALVSGRALSDRRGEPVSGTRAFAIDGRKFLAEDPADDGLSSVRRELAKRGIDTPSVSANLASVLDPRSLASLREEPAQKSAHPLPRGLEPDHFLMLETVTGPVEISFGRVACPEEDLIGRLRSSGWECRESDAHGATGALAHLMNGKEASVVLLEKTQRRFLTIRRVVR